MRFLCIKGVCCYLVIACVLCVLDGCAPKRVRVFAVPDKIRSDVVLSALSLQGKPYRSGGRGPDAFDCSGLVYYVFKKNQILLPPPAEAQLKSGYEVGHSTAQPGDIVFFRIDGAFHAGILINSAEFVHASKSRGVAVGNLNSDYWRRNLHAFRSVL